MDDLIQNGKFSFEAYQKLVEEGARRYAEEKKAQGLQNQQSHRSEESQRPEVEQSSKRQANSPLTNRLTSRSRTDHETSPLRQSTKRKTPTEKSDEHQPKVQLRAQSIDLESGTVSAAESKIKTNAETLTRRDTITEPEAGTETTVKLMRLRQPPVSAFGDGRRLKNTVSSYKIPKSLKLNQGSSSFAPSKASPAKSASAASDQASPRTPSNSIAPKAILKSADKEWGNNIEWLAKMKIDMKRNDKEIAQLKLIKDPISACQNLKEQEKLSAKYEKIRGYLHQYRHLKVDAQMVRNSRLLEVNTGLPYLFLGGHQFPFDIKADAKELAMKWRRRDFDPDMMRGIDYEGGTNKYGRLKGDTMKLRADDFGELQLANGQWFPTWLCAVRDGAHGSSQAGIYGRQGKGAFSVVMAGTYDDVDNGDRVEYCGVSKAAPFENDANSTRLLFQNVNNRDRPVRLLRSQKLNSKKGDVNVYAPEIGLRYDGLYHVTGSRTISEEKGEYRFFLERVPGQDPIRYQGTSKRPTDLEIQEYNIHKQKLKGIGA